MLYRDCLVFHNRILKNLKRVPVLLGASVAFATWMCRKPLDMLSETLRLRLMNGGDK